MTLTKEQCLWAWLADVEGIGLKSFDRLMEIYGDPQTVWDNVGDPAMSFLGRATLDKLASARNPARLDALGERITRAGLRVLIREAEDYPVALRDIYQPPPVLYVLGGAELCPARSFSIVGSRRCTRDGVRAGREIGEALAREGVTIVSGMAHGIDTAAHEGALIGMGTTIAVLGCGADVIYPKENEQLYHRILEGGGAILSEYAPGTQPRPGNFPPRNRVISGLTPGTLLIEAAERSGAMITVGDALDQGRDVFAVPGSIYSALSAAPNRLIVEGAIPVLSGWDILEHYGWAQRPDARVSAPKAKLELTEEDDKIVRPLLEQALSFDELANIVDLSPSKLNSHLTMLELRGIIVKVPGGQYKAYIS